MYRGRVTGKAPKKADRDSDSTADADPEAEARARYVNALIARGEAARAVDGELPDGATHEILEDADGNLSVVRRRFSIG